MKNDSLKIHKDSFLYRFQKSKSYQKILAQEREILDIALDVAEARRKKRMTQAQLAKKTGMLQSQIARIESGNHNVTLGTLNKVTSALNLRVKVVG